MNILYAIYVNFLLLLLMICLGLCNSAFGSTAFTTALVSSKLTERSTGIQLNSAAWTFKSPLISTLVTENLQTTTNDYSGPNISENFQSPTTLNLQTTFKKTTGHIESLNATDPHLEITESTSDLPTNNGNTISTSNSHTSIGRTKSTFDSSTIKESTLFISESSTNIGRIQWTSDSITGIGSVEFTSYSNINIRNIESTSDTRTDIGSREPTYSRTIIEGTESVSTSSTKGFTTSDKTSTISTTPLFYDQSYNSRRGYVWIVYIIVCILTIPAIIAYTFYQIKGMKKKELLDRELIRL